MDNTMEFKIPGSNSRIRRSGISNKYKPVRMSFALSERTNLNETNPPQDLLSTLSTRLERSQRLARYKPVRLPALKQDALPENQFDCGQSKARKRLWADNKKIQGSPTVRASKLARRTLLREYTEPRYTKTVTFGQTIFDSPKPTSILKKPRKSKCDSDCSHIKETVEIKHTSTQTESPFLSKTNKAHQVLTISVSPAVDLSDSLRDFTTLENSFKSPMPIKSAKNIRIPTPPTDELYKNLLAEVQELRARIEILERKDQVNAVLGEKENVSPMEKRGNAPGNYSIAFTPKQHKSNSKLSRTMQDYADVKRSIPLDTPKIDPADPNTVVFKQGSNLSHKFMEQLHLISKTP